MPMRPIRVIGSATSFERDIFPRSSGNHNDLVGRLYSLIESPIEKEVAPIRLGAKNHKILLVYGFLSQYYCCCKTKIFGKLFVCSPRFTVSVWHCHRYAQITLGNTVAIRAKRLMMISNFKDDKQLYVNWFLIHEDCNRPCGLFCFHPCLDS